jgi:hypothetical protein
MMSYKKHLLSAAAIAALALTPAFSAHAARNDGNKSDPYRTSNMENMETITNPNVAPPQAAMQGNMRSDINNPPVYRGETRQSASGSGRKLEQTGSRAMSQDYNQADNTAYNRSANQANNNYAYNRDRNRDRNLWDRITD